MAVVSKRRKPSYIGHIPVEERCHQRWKRHWEIVRFEGIVFGQGAVVSKDDKYEAALYALRDWILGELC